MKYVVFLDIDGVFASARVHEGQTSRKGAMWDKFDPVAVDFMNRLDAVYDIDFVLMSTWKDWLNVDDGTIYHWVSSSFRNSGFTGNFAYPMWKTNPYNAAPMSGQDRAHEVKHYLETYGTHYEDYLLFDDSSYRFNDVLPHKRFVKTDPINGLLHKHMLRALSLVGNWKQKGETK